MEGQITPKPYVAKDDSEGEKLLELLNEVYNRKMINRVTDFYAENAIVHTVGNKDLVGYDEIQGAIISLLASFPNARLVLERVTCNKYPDSSCHAAVRWWLRGLHEGLGPYGKPTGKPVEILGITQYRFEAGKIAETWEIYDGLDVLRQLHLGDDENKEMV